MPERRKDRRGVRRYWKGGRNDSEINRKKKGGSSRNTEGGHPKR